ncbi:unnamed protein product [marine sediment metagenome]|uniref:Uncharacterized protein n=1 Tax=marine sediment metagenome TaxID=412755 RepID=X1F7B6_9ZZZZ
MFNKKEYDRQWRLDNPGWTKQWRKDNSEKIKQYNKDHREERNRNVLKYFKTEKGKIAHRRQSRNHRELGFNPLNEYFEGSTGHHINKNDVIYILKELHQSISHCLKTGKNMKRINKLAIEYLS